MEAASVFAFYSPEAVATSLILVSDTFLTIDKNFCSSADLSQSYFRRYSFIVSNEHCIARSTTVVGTHCRLTVRCPVVAWPQSNLIRAAIAQILITSPHPGVSFTASLFTATLSPFSAQLLLPLLQKVAHPIRNQSITGPDIREPGSLSQSHQCTTDYFFGAHLPMVSVILSTLCEGWVQDFNFWSSPDDENIGNACCSKTQVG